MNLARFSASWSASVVAAIITVACSSSSSTPGADAGSGASSGSGGGAGSSADSDGSAYDGAAPCGRISSLGAIDIGSSPPCPEATPVCCARAGKLLCVETGGCTDGTAIVGCRPTSCPSGKVCCGTLLGNATQSSCESSCSGFTVQICSTADAGAACPAGFACLSFGIIDSATGYCSQVTSFDDGGSGGG